MAEVQVQDKGGKDGKVRSKKVNVRVDMTPMVDLGFLLITFFMLATTLSKPNTMDMKLPAKPEKDQKIDIPEIDLTNSITFLLGKDNKVYYHQLDQTGLTDPSKLQETTFDKNGIEKVIDDARRRARKPDIFTVIIKPTDDSNYKNFVDLLDEMAITKSERYGIGEVKPWEQKIYDQKIGK
ncbi:biopolymer transporter ExbD [Elizabethkingia anophelis]|uniref:Biopolymer transport protein ExbD/TolR n=2 Tax=Elizabethkingia anophelis TaxID=1117645 RepID=A0A077E950_9FLAO|nr:MULTISPECIES: biopolymer transporter ExbD [Elizabethkingia]AIL44067.1 Biopolymer transport protein ExbD/TolR [Elizabethkingia anophelis NUHP1]AKH93032.1 outer membrane transport energization protein exbd [Elizabethkingia anophelis FMS-007]AMR42548.1 biopolymer transporter ExbD [Elizabethkingia anophelis]AMX49188.1 biopolymer transporter ExbD [Elizabethkingia anophelis]AMX52646.1 biopolymer transporter ExbD [Elizabethkingia anophelis]